MAITVTPATVGARFPEFAKVDPATIQTWIDTAICNVNACEWGKRANIGVEFLTAHYLSYFADPDCVEPAPGPITSEREGQVATTYKVADRFGEEDLGSTKYGRAFISQRRKIFVNRKL